MPSIIIFTACLSALKEARGLSSSTIAYLHASRCHFALDRCGRKGGHITHTSQHVWHACCGLIKFSECRACGTIGFSWCHWVKADFELKCTDLYQLNMTIFLANENDFKSDFNLIWGSLNKYVFLGEYVLEYMGQFSTLKPFPPSLWKLRSHNQLFSNIIIAHQCCINLLSSLFGNRLSDYCL